MTRSARVYDFTIPADGAITVLAEGSFYRLMTAAGGIEVRRNNGSIVGPLLPGQGERAEFLSLTLTDKSGASNPGSILIGDDTFIDDRISGEVSVINGGLARTIAGVAFMAGQNLAALAGNYSAVQLWNPAGSSANLIVSKVLTNSFTASTNIHLRTSNAALSSLAAAQPASKLINGAAASVAELRTDQTAALQGQANMWAFLSVPSNLNAPLTFDEPIVIKPSNGLIVSASIVNANCAAFFDYWERPA